MNFDFIAYPLGKFLLFIYNTVAFHNYGLAIIFFTIIVRLALLPLTLKQYKSSAKMQELQPIIADIQKRYKDDKEKLNQELMKVYQENGYNPASGCLPLLIQMPILITLYWVIIQPLKFMLGKPMETINTLVEVARKGMGWTTQAMGFQRELHALNYFNENRSALSQVKGLLSENELVDFNNFLGLHLGKTASYHLDKLFGPESYIYIPLFILAILAVVTTYFSSKLAMPKNNSNKNNNSQQNAMANSMTNTMLYFGPLMTLLFSFQLPGGVVLYWMAGYVVAIFQQLYINKYVLKRDQTPEQKAIRENRPGIANRPGGGNMQPGPGNGIQGSGDGTAGGIDGSMPEAGSKPGDGSKSGADGRQKDPEGKQTNPVGKQADPRSSKKGGPGGGSKGGKSGKKGAK